MKRIGLLLITLLLLLAACGSNQTDLAGQVGGDEELVGESEPTSAGEETSPTSEAEAPAVEVDQDDPTLARERDWKLGDATDPAVTIIEYGDFQ
jgi:hypothetical protein